MYELTCELCGKKFMARTKQQKVCHWPHEKTCEQCGKVFYLKNNNNKNTRFCSLECSGKYRKKHGISKEVARKAGETRLKRYGSKGLFKTTKPRKCIICGKEFVPVTSNNRQTCYEDHYKPCYICGNPVKVNSLTYKRDVTCSRECTTQKMLNTMDIKYGPVGSNARKFIDKKIETNRLKYGTDWSSQNERIKRSVIVTNVRKYGTPVSSQSDVVKQKAKRTFMEHFGVDNPMKCSEIVDKLRVSNTRKYGVPSPTQTEEVKRKIKETCLIRYGVPWSCMSNRVRSHNGKLVSKLNKDFCSLLETAGMSYEMEFRLENRSFDIRVSNSRCLVEIDPTSTHNTHIHVFSGTCSTVSSDYHLNKTKLAESHGYRCIHVWDWDDWEKVVRLVLPTSRRVYARKCHVVKLDKEATDKFLSDNHLQGTCKGQVVRLGLVCDDELVEVMTFGKPRYNRKFEWELLRLCALPGTSVVGGPSKLFSHFVREYSPKSVLSYCDRSKFTGKVYESIGMTLADQGTPNKHWYSPRKSERMQHVTNNFLLQRGFDQIFGTSYGKGTSNEQLMLERGYLPVYDCGQMRFEWHSS